MKMRIFGFLAMVLAAISQVHAGASKGSCVSKAKSLSATQSVTLVTEYDSEEKEYYDNGVMYYTVTLKRGQAYTIWIEGGNASEMNLEIEPNWEYYDKEKHEDSEPSASFDLESIDSGNTQFGILYADDWTLPEAGAEKGDYDPKEAKFVVAVYGEVGARTTLHYMKGVKTFTMVGTESAPKAITPTSAWKSYSGKLIDGEFYFRATLKAGQKYRVRTTGGTAAAPLMLNVDDGSGDDDETETSESIFEDSAYASDTNNEALVILPDTTAKYAFTVSGGDVQKFRFLYTAVPKRAIASHPAMPLLPENDYSVSFTPGRLCSTQKYYDDIVDEHLCKIYLKKGERWVFETEGATSYQRMYAYNTAGKVLSTNEGLGDAANDTRVVITATASGLYYVGVCDPTLDVDELPDTSVVSMITLRGRNVSDYMLPDSYDPVDDVPAGANWLVPYPATTNDHVLAVTEGNREAAEALGAIHAGHKLNANDIHDTFALACRKGYTYRLAATWTDPNVTSSLSLGAKVFYLAGTTERAVAAVGSISPGDGVEELEFTPTVSGVHYVRVFVADGTGLDYPSYDVHAMVANGTNALGLVQVDLAGDVGSWSVNTESYKYPSGAVLALMAGTSATRKITFNAATGFSLEPTTAALPEIPAWCPGDEPVRVSAVYSDTYDKKYVLSSKTTTNAKTGKKTTVYTYSPADGDATPAGAFAIAPAATAATLKRTLWADDPADNFKFTASAGVYYTFTLAGPTNFAMVVSNATEGVVAEAVPLADGSGIGISKALLPAGVSYVVVTHGGEAEGGSAYRLTHSRAATGVVQFVMPTTKVKSGTTTKTVTLDAFSAKEGAQYASLVVARTGKEGAVRVRYATQAISAEVAAERFGCEAAQPGTNYYPVSDGTLSWAVGDKANKTIKIPLIPDAMAHWAASNRVFSVVLYPVDEYELASGEYLARTNAVLASAAVKIVEANAAKPGTLALASCGESSVANAKKPAVSAVAGATNTFMFVRTGGSDGTVKLKVATTTAKGDTAKVGVDYETVTTNLVWESGDAEPKMVDVYLPSATTYAASRKFTLALTAVKGTHKPALAAATAAVTILSDEVKQTAAAYAKTIAASTGLKLASTGTWYKDPAGVLRSAPANGTVTYTLTGPGLFVCRPVVVAEDPETDGAKLTCTIDKEAAVACEGEPVVRTLGSGTHTVKFTLSGVTGGAYAKFDPSSAGEPYLWAKFSLVAPVSPLNKAAVVAEDLQSLDWTTPAEFVPVSNLYVRVRCGATAKTMTEVGIVPFVSGAISLPEALPEGVTRYWALDYALSSEGAPTSEVWSSLRGASGATWQFATVKAGAPLTTFSADAVDATGAGVAALVAAGEPVELIQAVKVDLELAGESSDASEDVITANAFRLVAGALPKGMSISSAGAITGTPGVTGEFNALLQGGVKTVKKTTVTVNGKKTTKTTTTYSWSGTTLPVTFRVLPAGTALGSFRAALEEDGMHFERDARRHGVLTLSVTSAGKFSAKATIGGVAYSFAGTGYDEIVDRDESLPGCTRMLRVRLTNTTLINKKTKTYNYLTVTMPDGALTNGVALAEAVGEVELEMNVANTKLTSVVKDVLYRGELFRGNGGTEVGKAALADFVGYYTAGLVPEAVTAADGVPVGSGYLTFTVADSGSVKVAGVLADGTSVSYTSIGELVGDDLANPRTCRLRVPFFAGKTTVYSVAGVAEIGYENPADENALPVLLPTAKVFWAKTAAAATSRDGSGFCLSLAPTGGWYNKTENLQNHYLNAKFALATVETAEELPTYALAKGYSFMVESVPQDMGISFVGNTLTPDAKKLVKTSTTGLYDTWQTDPTTHESVATSVNPWSVTTKFTRSTGIITGTLSAWEWTFKYDEAGFPYATAQKEIKKLAHKGVWLYSRDGGSESPLRADACSAGYFLMQGAKSWKASLPFTIYASPADHDWLEKDMTSE